MLEKAATDEPTQWGPLIFASGDDKLFFERYKWVEICRFPVSGCLQNTSIQDEELFIGRVQINLNDGKKRKYLYFQSDYKVLGKNLD